MGLIQRMKNQQTMTERERDICNYILEHPEKVESISSRELGHVTFTSAASVTRLCQKLGMKGFPEFKIQFVRELQKSYDIGTRECRDDCEKSNSCPATGNRRNKEGNFLQSACKSWKNDCRGLLCGFLCI